VKNVHLLGVDDSASLHLVHAQYSDAVVKVTGRASSLQKRALHISDVHLHRPYLEQVQTTRTVEEKTKASVVVVIKNIRFFLSYTGL